MLDEIEESKKEERKKNNIEIFMFDYLDCEKSRDSGGIFYIRIAKGFRL